MEEVGALGFRRLRTRKMGHYVLIDMEVQVEPTISVSSALRVCVFYVCVRVYLHACV